MPFNGLGFDLEAVKELAQGWELSPMLPEVPRTMPAAPERLVSVFGYELLLVQGREIRAG